MPPTFVSYRSTARSYSIPRPKFAKDPTILFFPVLELLFIPYGELHGDNPENTSKIDIDKNAI